VGEGRKSRRPGLVEIALGLLLGSLLLAWAYWDTEPPAPSADPLASVESVGPSAQAAPETPVVVYVTYGLNPLMNPIHDAFVARLAEGGAGARVVELEGGGQPGAPPELALRIRDMPNVSVVVATTTAVAVPVAARVRGRTPLVFAAVSDPVGSGLVPSLENAAGSGVTGSSDRCTVEAQLAFFRELFPDARRLGFLHGELTDRVPPLPVDDASAIGLTLVPVETRVLSDLPRAERALAMAGIDVLLVHPNWAADYTVYSGFPRLARHAVERGWPVVVTDETNVSRGALAGLGSDLSAAGVAAADATLAILQGADPGSIPVTLLPCAPPIVNRTVLEALGLELPTAVATRARYVTTRALPPAELLDGPR
jgi:putative ABC transport system substrate-binding protein